MRRWPVKTGRTTLRAVPRPPGWRLRRGWQSKADWYDPELHPKLQSFVVHYGTVILPAKPYRPDHKGKVEAGVKYVKNNGLKGKSFSGLEQENAHLLDWEQTVADTRRAYAP